MSRFLSLHRVALIGSSVLACALGFAPQAVEAQAAVQSELPPSAAARDTANRPEVAVSPEARAAVEKGIELIKQKQFKGAIEALLAAARRHPQNGQLRHLLGFAYAQNDQLGHAWLQFRQAVRFNLGYPEGVRDFLAMWDTFDRGGTFNIGATPEMIQKVLGNPDANTGNGDQLVYDYGFMRLNFLQGKLFSVVDPRGLDPADVKPVDAMKASLDDTSRWRLGYRAVNRLQTVTEYVPNGQTVQNWEELFTVQRLYRMTERGTTPEVMMGRIKDNLAEVDPKMAFEVVSQSEEDVLFQWKDAGTKERLAQHEIVRLIAGKRDIHRLAYSRHVAEIPAADAQAWIGLLQQATLTDTPQQP